MNNKGFSLVEIIAVIAILGILSGITIMAANEYLKNSRNKVYASMEESIYNATENMLSNPPSYDTLINAGISSSDASNYLDGIDTIKGGSNYYVTLPVKLLIKLDYLESLSDPAKKGSNCNENSTVSVANKSSSNSNALQKLTYKVRLKCSNYNKEKIFPLE